MLKWGHEILFSSPCPRFSFKSRLPPVLVCVIFCTFSPYCISSSISQDGMWGMIHYNCHASNRRLMVHLHALHLLPLWIPDVSVAQHWCFSNLNNIHKALLFYLGFHSCTIYRIIIQFSHLFCVFKLLWILHSYMCHNLVLTWYKCIYYIIGHLH